MTYNDSEIISLINEWVNRKIGVNFQFREHQLECIVQIIQNILNKKYQNYIVEAPTGSGKSLINIISAGVLADYFNITSYILCSDLFLWEQYEKFLHKYRQTGIASLKGQTGNYSCKLNGEDIKNADCRMAGLSWSSLFNKTVEDFECAKTCPYVKARKKAIKAKVCVMTYQLFLFIMNNPNYNTDSQGMPIFKVHDVLFCDECHNIPDIVQLQYSPTIVTDHWEKLKALYDGSTEHVPDLFDDHSDCEDEDDVHYIYKNWDGVYKELSECWNIWVDPSTSKETDISYANKYLKILESFYSTCNDIKQRIMIKKQSKVTLSKDDVKMFKICSWYENHMCEWHDYCTAIDCSGVEYSLKDITIANDDNHVSVAFKCTKEDFITWFFFLQRAKYKVMVSATVGSKDAYDERMGFHHEDPEQWENPNEVINESYMTILPSTFDFSQSPIYFFNKFKMSYNERENSFNHLKVAIYSIVSSKFKNQKGMIQTGSYEFAKRLYNDAPEEIRRRMLLYSGSKEKVSIVKRHQMSHNTILIGPTLNTGVDLPGDNCRFIIILKVPYPSLADKLTNARVQIYPSLYNSHTYNEIIQGIGRGVRFNGDYCTTYILDACFSQLFYSTKNQYPQELQERIKII